MEEKEVRVKDVTKGDYQSWKHHPVTKVYLQFLKDKKQFVQDVAVGQWLQGNPLSDTLRGQIVELEDLSMLEFESISNFYAEAE